MKNAVVIYKSHYGHTQTYAKWLSESLDCDLFEHSKIKKEKLFDYDTIIFGGGLYASGINGISLITKNFNRLKNKNIIVFTVGLTKPEIKDQFKPILNKNFTCEMQEKIHIYHLRGGINYKTLSFLHKKMMGMMKKMIQKKPDNEKTNEDRQLLETYGHQIDFLNQNSLLPIINDVTSLMNQE